MDRDTAVKAIAGVRLATGVTSYVAPNFGGRLFGLAPAANPQAPYVARLFGARDVALAAGMLRSKRKAQRQWIELGLACDLADTAAGVMGGTKGYLPASTTAMVTLPAVAVAALGVTALRS